mmetsp:Transcript_15402/g.33730  ORF Transcript_15402/g.33730 Transcript_15402/m.33730 type:complete len:81 (-) Transcript_15402:979-1221(-)
MNGIILHNNTLNLNSMDNLKVIGSRFGYKYSSKNKFVCKTHSAFTHEVDNYLDFRLCALCVHEFVHKLQGIDHTFIIKFD